VVAPLNNSTLQNISGTIALAGAGKMGGAMLTGWLAGGLDPTRAIAGHRSTRGERCAA
jgi:pyrroline-5-carboxylate reductase